MNIYRSPRDKGADGEISSPEVELLNRVNVPGLTEPDFTGKILSPSAIVEARHLVGEVYSRWGYVDSEQLTPEGYLPNDTDIDNSTYFACFRGDRVAATVRLVTKPNIREFQTVAEFGVDPARLEDIDTDPSHFREVRALAKRPGLGHRDDVLRLYASMMRESLETDVRYWLMSADTRLAGKLRRAFGGDSFPGLADEKFYLGSPTEPMLLDVRRGVQVLCRRFFLPADVKAIFRGGL